MTSCRHVSEMARLLRVDVAGPGSHTLEASGSRDLWSPEVLRVRLVTLGISWWSLLELNDA